MSMLQQISNSNKCCCFLLSIAEDDSFHKNVKERNYFQHW